jgi:hypothetical protein
VVESRECIESHEEYCLGELKLEQEWDQVVQDQHRLNMYKVITAAHSWHVLHFFPGELLAASSFSSSHDLKPSIAARLVNK